MTAEIAILNKSALALAADSAGTIGQGGNAKIYNAFNKIFELSEHAPVGIMIYGGLDFMGLPLEAVIKQYRKQLGNKTFPHVNAYLTDFIGFLEKKVPWDDKNETSQILSILISYYQKLISIVDARIRQDLIDRGNYLRSKDNSIIESVLKDEAQNQSKYSAIEGFYAKIPPSLMARWKPVIEGAYEFRFERFKLSKANKKKLLDAGVRALVRGPLSEGRTGIVVAGFGADEWCPSLTAIETDGIVLGKLKYVLKEAVDIGRDGPHATMVGFAQDDMVSTFLNGVDPRYEYYVNESMVTFFADLTDKFKATTNVPSQQLSILKNFFDHIRGEMNSKLLEFRNKSFKTPILEMIRFMPVQELATLAASMIEITSLKRRVTRDRETVGGEVDVAVITKAEGFVWIKRKHYFPAELNPRFFRRLERPLAGEAR